MSAINLALNRPAYSSSSVLPYTAGRAVNGSTAPTSRWLCCNLPGWICVDLGVAYRVNRWIIRNMSTAGWASPDYNIVDFKLQGSNTVTDERSMSNSALWTDLDTVTGNSLAIVDHTLPSIVTYRYFRMYVSKGLRCNTKLASAMELEIYKAPDSSKLTNLVLNNTAQQCIVMQPTFNMNTTAYTATVPYDTASVTLTPTAEQGNAIIKVNGVAATNGQPSAPVSLNVGSNAIPVQVTAGDSTSQTTYTVTVTRASSPYLTKVDVTYKSGKSPTTQTIDIITGQTEYNCDIPNTITNVTITPYSQDTSAAILVNGDQNLISGETSSSIPVVVGTTRIPINVTSSIGVDSEEYGITIV
ncbi:F5/8 type C domain-containing protein [Anaerobacterium chartisolvens]|uniref:F5/8 type C domain-containing protein n=1 Tax=Anaerobacterium chartisolvens TaxID=1297424 RepID=A0A369BB34_9FIRM|nr:cadherin-like beta sandwich domain-containing protein [Anaerobacterium chartisolvens]RCX18733.1 F5/8 type C domain-containing protein [Anaerobacterium chartisolvens]